MNWVSKHHTPHLNNHYSESLAGKWFQSISHSCWWHFSLQLYPCYAESLTLAAEKEFLISPKKSKDRIFLGGYFCLSALFCCLFVFYVFIILYYTWYHHVSAMKVNKYSVLIIFSSHLQVLFYFLFFIHSIFLLIHSCLSCQIEREVTEAMMKSLKYCDLQTDSARQPLYQYRAATIHHRLASMYHSCFRNQVGSYVKLYNSRKPFSFPFECLGCSLC